VGRLVIEPEMLSSMQVIGLVVLILCASVGMAALTMPLYFRSSLFDQPPTYDSPSSGPPLRRHGGQYVSACSAGPRQFVL
jgi:hypothetical protein